MICGVRESEIAGVIYNTLPKGWVENYKVQGKDRLGITV
jgi:hypothetical protein